MMLTHALIITPKYFSIPHFSSILFWHALLCVTFYVIFFCYFSRYFFFVLLENFQEYQEEFRDISGKSTKKLTGGSIADGNITLINQRHVGDDLPV